MGESGVQRIFELTSILIKAVIHPLQLIGAAVRDLFSELCDRYPAVERHKLARLCHTPMAQRIDDRLARRRLRPPLIALVALARAPNYSERRQN